LKFPSQEFLEDLDLNKPLINKITVERKKEVKFTVE
jgi:hypothetical protein